MGMNERVLIVDDNPIFRRHLRQLLTLAGFSDIVEASDMAEACQIVRQFPLDLAVVDVMLPGESGLEGTPKLKALSDNLRVVLISAYQNFGQAAENVGADEFIPKDELNLGIVQSWKCN